EIAGTGAEKFRELSKIGDLPENLAAEIGIEPVCRFGRNRALTTHGQLVFALLDVELLELDLTIVEDRAEHDHVGGTIAPAQPIQLGPDGSGSFQRIAGIAAKSEIAGTKRTTELIGKSERLGRLGERNAGRGAGEVPNRMLPRPFIRNARANFSAEDIKIELEIGALFIEPRQIDGDGLKIDSTG